MSCSTGVISSGETYSSVDDCLGSEDEALHSTCTEFCNNNLWAFIPGVGEGCYTNEQDNEITAFCVCQLNCPTCPPFGTACLTECSTGVISSGETYDNQAECLGTDNEEIHETCTDFCQDNNWSFVPGYGEGCWIGSNGEETAFCVCHTGCFSGNCPEFGYKCALDYPVCVQDGHSVNIRALLDAPSVASCGTSCFFYDWTFESGCSSQGCYIDGSNLGPCVMTAGSSEYYCHCGEITFKPPGDDFNIQTII